MGVPLGVGAALLPEGLRYEALSVALTMAGFALIECGFTGGVSVFAAFLLMFLGGATAPRMTVFSAVLFCWPHGSYGDCGRGLRLRDGGDGVLHTGSGGACGRVRGVLWLIDFRVGEFWTTFHYHMKGATARSGGGKLKLIVFYLHQIQTQPMAIAAVTSGVCWSSLSASPRTS